MESALLFVSSVATLTIIAKLLTNKSHPKDRKQKSYLTYSNQHLESCIAVDCSHPSIAQLTHHLRDVKTRALMLLSPKGAYSSTDAVLNAILTQNKVFEQASFITTNHFDIDSFLSVWCALNPDLAVLHEELLRIAARIGDFREAIDLTTNPTTDLALRIVCWINTVEQKEFYRPFEEAISAMGGEAAMEDKLQYFAPRLTALLQDQEGLSARILELLPDYWVEYSRVISDCLLLSDTATSSSVMKHTDISLTIIHSQRPLHYYALFSASIDTDIVLSVSDNNCKVEVEQKYTAHVSLGARRVLPKVDMRPLAKHLTVIERAYRADSDEFEWHADGPTDSGPLLRLEQKTTEQHRLTKAERYAHPYERRIASTAIHISLVESTVVSYFQHAYKGYRYPNHDGSKRREDEDGDSLTWKDINEFNRAIDWKSWQVEVPKEL